MIRLSAIAFILLTYCANLPGQSEVHISDTLRVNESFLNKPLIEVIDVFEKKYNCLLAYEATDIADVYVHRYLTDLTIPEALRDVLENSGLEYQFLENNEILIRKDRRFNGGTEVVLNGRITGKDSQRPLEWATVYDSASGRTCYTDDQGRFRLKLLQAPPSGVLKINYLGYIDEMIPWSHKEGELFVAMQPTDYMLNEVVIVERLPALNTKTLPQLYRQKHTLNKLALASPGMPDALREIQLLPGISSTNDLSAGLRIRGGDENESLYLLDGIEFFNVDHFFGIFSAFDQNTIDSTSVYLSDFPIQYGGRTSGVVDMRLKNPAGKKLNGQLGVHSLYSFLNLESRLTKKSGILLSTRFTNGDISDRDIYDVLFSNTESPREVAEERQRLNEVTPFFRFNDAQLKWQWTPDDASSFSATLYRGRDMSRTDYLIQYDGLFERRRSVYTETYDENITWDNTGINLSYDQTVSSRWSFSLDFSANEYQLRQNIATSLKVENPFLKDSILLNNTVSNNITGVTLQWHNTFRPFKDHVFDWGLELENHTTVSRATNQDTTLQNLQDSSANISLFGSYLFPMSDKLNFKLGIRYNGYSPTQSTYLSPRASLQFQMNRALSFAISGGVYNQFLRNITYNDRFGKSHDFWILANDDRGILKSFHFNFTSQYQTDDLLFKLELYRKKSLNEIVQIWLVNGFNNSNIPTATDFRTFTGTGNYYGLNLYSRYRHEWYELTLSYSLAKNTISVAAIDEGDPFPASNDRRHELSLINSFSLGKWTLGNTIIYGSGFPYVSSLLIDDRDIRNLEVEERIARLPDYFRIDLAANYRFTVWNQEMVAGLSIYNLLDWENSDQVQYLYNLNNQNTMGEDFIIGSEINLLPRTIDISLEWHF